MNKIIYKNNGFSLFEMVVVIIVLSVLVTIAMRNLQPNIDLVRTEETKTELEQIAFAIAGIPDLFSSGNRIDYGYVGDVGILPANLQDLVTNPGYGTWDGPYIKDDFYASTSSPESEFLIDSWGQTYSYSGSVTISSNGGGTTITKEIAGSNSDLLLNSTSFNIYDIENCPPGADDIDSVVIIIEFPNGIGGYQTVTKNPSMNGFVQFDSLPIGQHSIRVIDLKNDDTLRTKININPKSSTHNNLQIPSSLWCDTTSTGGGGGGGVSAIETLRPNGSGSTTNLEDENCSTNWRCVDESSSDGNSTYVKGDGNSWEYDLYNVANSSISSGTIDSIVVFLNVRGNGGNQKARTYIRTNGNNYSGSQITPTSSYSVYSTTYITNPSSSSAWTWSQIDALQIGAGLRREARLTQVWVEIYYTN